MKKQCYGMLLLVLSTMVFAANGKDKLSQKPIYTDSLVFQVIEQQFVLDHETVKKASLITGADGEYVGLKIELKPEISAEFTKVSERAKGKRMNIVINNRIISSSIIQSALGAHFLITGVKEKEAMTFINNLLLHQRK